MPDEPEPLPEGDQRQYAEGTPSPPALRLTPELAQDIVDAVAQHKHIRTAFAEHDIPRRTWRHWLAEAAKGREPYATFADRLYAAESKVLNDLRAQWAGHFGEDWRAIESYAKRRFPEELGDRAEHTVQGPDGGPIQHKVLAFDPSAYPPPPTDEDDEEE